MKKVDLKFQGFECRENFKDCSWTLPNECKTNSKRNHKHLDEKFVHFRKEKNESTSSWKVFSNAFDTFHHI